PPFPTATKIAYAPNANLTKLTDALAKKTEFKGTCVIIAVGNKNNATSTWFAVDNNSPIPYAGWEYAKSVDGYSVSKLEIMIAAYALRAAVRSAAGETGARSPEDLFKALRSRWEKSASTRFPKRPPDFPDLPSIFSAQSLGNSKWNIDFKSASADLATLAKLEEIHHGLEHAHEDKKKGTDPAQLKKQ